MTALENAIVRLLKARPFYGHLLLNLRREQLHGANQAAGITIRDGIPVLAIAAEAFTTLLPSQQEALLEHLLKHLLHLHPLRRRERNPHDWDVACDLAINPGITQLPPGALNPVAYQMPQGLAAEEYYDLIVPPLTPATLRAVVSDQRNRIAGERPEPDKVRPCGRLRLLTATRPGKRPMVRR